MFATDVETRHRELPPLEPFRRSESPGASRMRYGVWVAFVVVALLLLNVLGDSTYAIVVPTGHLRCRSRRPSGPANRSESIVATWCGRPRST